MKTLAESYDEWLRANHRLCGSILENARWPTALAWNAGAAAMAERFAAGRGFTRIHCPVCDGGTFKPSKVCTYCDSTGYIDKRPSPG